MINYRKLASPSAVLASCLVGVIITPYVYIGIGALSNFSIMFSLVMLPPLLAASIFLLWQYLIKQKRQKKGVVTPVIESVSWLIVITFLFFISQFSLFSVLERVGLFCTCFLIASALCLPFIAWRNALIEQRIKGLPKGIVTTVVIMVLVSSVLVVIAYQLNAPRFI